MLKSHPPGGITIHLQSQGGDFVRDEENPRGGLLQEVLQLISDRISFGCWPATVGDVGSIIVAPYLGRFLLFDSIRQQVLLVAAAAAAAGGGVVYK